MQIIIKSKQMQVTPQLRQWIERKVQRLSRLLHEDTRVEITVAEEQTRSASDRFTVHVNVSGNSHSAHPVRSESSAQSTTAALDLVVDKIFTQLSRQKGRVTARRHHATPIKVLALSRAGLITSLEEEAAARAEVESEDNEEIWSKVMEIRRLPTRAMTDQEVIAQMEQSGNAFYPFFNQETNSVNVMYKLESGGYGLLVPAVE